MPGKLKIMITDDDFIESLGEYGPILQPIQVDFKTALYIVNDGHDVKAILPSGKTSDFDIDQVKKMIKRGEKGIEDLWEEIQLEKEIAKEEAVKKSDEKNEKKSDKKKEVDYSKYNPDNKDELDDDEDPGTFKASEME